MRTLGLAIPIVWQMLPKKGNSQTTERIDLMEKFAALLGQEQVGYLTTDREFVGKQWFQYLSGSWGFCIRIRHTDLIRHLQKRFPYYARVLALVP